MWPVCWIILCHMLYMILFSVNTVHFKLIALWSIPSYDDWVILYKDWHLCHLFNMEHGLTYFCFNYYFVSISLDQSTQEASQGKCCVCLCACLTAHLPVWVFVWLWSTCPRPTHNISSVFLDIVSVLLVGLNGKGKRNVWLTLTSAWVTRDVDLLIPLPITVRFGITVVKIAISENVCVFVIK